MAQSLARLLNIRKKNPDTSKRSYGTNIRTLFIRFMLSFVVSGDNTTKKSVLEMKDLFSASFKGMIQDDYEVHRSK